MNNNKSNFSLCVSPTSIAWVFLSMASSHINVLGRFNNSEGLATFLDTRWLTLGLSCEDAGNIGKKLELMFPAPQKLDFTDAKTPRQVVNMLYQAWREGKKDVVFNTSGSTGKPTFALQREEMLRQECAFACTFFSEIKKIVALTPLHHCYAFMFGILLHEALGVPLTTSPPLPTGIKHSLASGELIIGFPDFWRSFSSLDHEFTPKDIYCLSAGAPWSKEDQKAIRACGFSNTIEIFGSSENGIIGWRRHFEDPFQLPPYFSPSVEADDSLTRNVIGEEITVPLQDGFSWLDSQCFLPSGRKDKALQVAGMNVYPAFVEKCLLQLVEIKECSVRLMRPEEGNRLKAFIVLYEGVDEGAILKKLKEFCLNKLSTPARPTKYTFGQSIPKKFGKICDW